MVDNFIERKHGREEVSYPDATWQHEWLKPVLEPTYGIILVPRASNANCTGTCWLYAWWRGHAYAVPWVRKSQKKWRNNVLNVSKRVRLSQRRRWRIGDENLRLGRKVRWLWF